MWDNLLPCYVEDQRSSRQTQTRMLCRRGSLATEPLATFPLRACRRSALQASQLMSSFGRLASGHPASWISYPFQSAVTALSDDHREQFHNSYVSGLLSARCPISTSQTPRQTGTPWRSLNVSHDTRLKDTRYSVTAHMNLQDPQCSAHYPGLKIQPVILCHELMYSMQEGHFGRLCHRAEMEPYSGLWTSTSFTFTRSTHLSAAEKTLLVRLAAKRAHIGRI
nr:hypothetical protein CFP56_78661 [Quercus suber]